MLRWACPQCEDGYFWNYDTYTCDACSTQMADCSKCSSHNANKVLRCTECADPTQMINPMLLGCVDKIEDCAEEPYDTQPGNLTVDPSGDWMCAECDEGFIWNALTKHCEPCAIENCNKCNNDGTKCEECHRDFFLEADCESCIPAFENCYASFFDYPEGLSIYNANEDYPSVRGAEP